MNTEAQLPEERIAELEEKLAESQRELASARQSSSYHWIMNVFLIVALLIGVGGRSSGNGFWGRNMFLVVLLLQFSFAIVWNVWLFFRALKEGRSTNQKC